MKSPLTQEKLLLLLGLFTLIITGCPGTDSISTSKKALGQADDKKWGTPQIISNNIGTSYFSQIAIDSSGNAIAVCVQYDGTRYNIMANRYIKGSGWGITEVIENDNRGGADYPQITVDPSGNAIAVWEQYNGTQTNIMANRYTKGSGWGTPALLENDNRGSASNPQIAIDSSGNAMAVWEQYDGTQQNIIANRYTKGSGWGTPVLLENDNRRDAYDPQIAVNPSGNAVAVWRQYDGTKYNIMANRYTKGSGWGSAILLDNNLRDAGSPQIAIDPSGNAIAVWQQYDGTQYNIMANRYTKGSGWGSAILLDNNLRDAGSPQIAIAPSGNAIAVWQQYDGKIYRIWACRFE